MQLIETFIQYLISSQKFELIKGTKNKNETLVHIDQQNKMKKVGSKL